MLDNEASVYTFEWLLYSAILPRVFTSFSHEGFSWQATLFLVYLKTFQRFLLEGAFLDQMLLLVHHLYPHPASATRRWN